MPEVLEQVKSAAYASVGVNLLITDAIVGREVATPDFMKEHSKLARKEATKALTEFRAYSEPHAIKLTDQLPARVAERITDNRYKAWDFLGIEAPAAKDETKQPDAKDEADAKQPDTNDETNAKDEADNGEPKKP